MWSSSLKQLRNLATLAALSSLPMSPLAEARELMGSLEGAYVNNADLLKRRQQLRAADEELSIARSGWLPAIDAEGSVGSARTRTAVPYYRDETAILEETDFFRRQITLNQPLWRGGRVFAQVERAKKRIAAGRLELQALEQDVLLSAAIAHLDLATAREILNFARYNRQVLEEHKNASQDRFSVGEVTRTDLAQAEARLAEAMAEEVRASGQLRSVRANYLEIVGEVAEEVENPEEGTLAEVFGNSFPDSLSEIEREMLTGNPELMARLDHERAAEAQVNADSAALLPQIDLTASNSRSVNTQFDDSWNDENRVSLNLRVPIFRGGASSARVRQSKQNLAGAATERELTRRRLLKEATENWSAHQTAKAEINFYQAQIIANQAAVTGVQAESEIGVRTVLDLLDAQRELFFSRVNLAQTRRNYLASGFQLMASIGKFTAVALGLDVAIYRPEEYSKSIDWKLLGTGGALESMKNSPPNNRGEARR